MSTFIYIICFFSYFSFLFKWKRSFDAFTFFYLCVSLYFLPVLTGLAVDWVQVFNRGMYSTPQANDLVGVSYYMSILYLYITCVTLVFQRFFRVVRSRECYGVRFGAGGDAFFYGLLYVLTVMLFVYLYFTGNLLKYDVAEKGGSSLFVIFTVLSVITLGFGVLVGGKFISVLTLFLALSTLATSTRTPLAFYFFFVFLSFMFGVKESFVVYMLRHKRIVAGLGFGVFCVYVSKYVYTYFNLFGFSGLSRLYEAFSGPEFCSVCGFEPALQLSIIDLIYRNQAALAGLDYVDVFVSWLAIFPVPLSFFGGSSAYVSEFVRESLFGYSGYSIAGNVLAEFLLVFGVLGPFIFVPFWLLVVSLVDRGIESSIRSGSKLKYLFCLIVLINVCFFWNRYMLGSALGNLRNYIYLYAAVVGVYFLLKYASNKGKVLN